MIAARALCLIACVLLMRVPASHAAESDTTIIHAGTVLLRANQAPLADRTLIVSHGVIASVREGYLTGDELGVGDARVVDLRTAFLMPGMIDTHVHLTTEPSPHHGMEAVMLTDADLAVRAAVNAQKLLAAGFTTVMDMGVGRRADERAIYAVRDAIARGDLPGPEILTAGSPISATGASRTGRLRDDVDANVGPQGVCDGPDDCRRAVREQIARGADFINFYNTGSLLSPNSPAQTFTDEEMRAIVKTAHALGRIAVADGGNTPGDASGVHAAIRVGADIIDTVTFPQDDTFRLAKRAEVHVAPHLYALDAAVGDSPDRLEEGSMGWLPRPILEALYELKRTERTLVGAYDAGAPLALAADSGVFEHGLNAHELVVYVAKGLPAFAALHAATLGAAEAHEIADRTGAIAPGMEADLVAFDVSPLEDIEAVLSPIFIMSDGRIHSDSRSGRWSRVRSFDSD